MIFVSSFLQKDYCFWNKFQTMFFFSDAMSEIMKFKIADPNKVGNLMTLFDVI